MTNQFEPAIDWNAYTEKQIQLYRVFCEYYFSQVDFETIKNMSAGELVSHGRKTAGQAFNLLNKIIRGEPYELSDELVLFVRRKVKLGSRTAIEKAVRGVTN